MLSFTGKYNIKVIGARHCGMIPTLCKESSMYAIRHFNSRVPSMNCRTTHVSQCWLALIGWFLAEDLVLASQVSAAPSHEPLHSGLEGGCIRLATDSYDPFCWCFSPNLKSIAEGTYWSQTVARNYGMQGEWSRKLAMRKEGIAFGEGNVPFSWLIFVVLT